MKNVLVNHGQCDNIIISQKHFLWQAFVITRPLSCWQQDSLLLTGPGIFSQILHRTPCLKCLFVRESNKKQRAGRIILNFTKGETFSSLMTTKYSWGQSQNVVPLLASSKKGLPLPFSLAKKRIYLDTQLKGQLTLLL